MALHITDPELDALAEHARRILKAPTKTDAIRLALERVVDEKVEADATGDSSLFERVRKVQDEVRRLGAPNPNFDEKAFLDEMWES